MFFEKDYESPFSFTNILQVTVLACDNIDVIVGLAVHLSEGAAFTEFLVSDGGRKMAPVRYSSAVWAIYSITVVGEEVHSRSSV